MDNYDIGGIGEGEGEEWERETDLLNLPPHPPGEGEGEECEGETDELLNLPPHPPEKSYCTHDMAKKLGKIMWDDIALIVPRIQQCILDPAILRNIMIIVQTQQVALL
jgi:hypothetical protein